MTPADTFTRAEARYIQNWAEQHPAKTAYLQTELRNIAFLCCGVIDHLNGESGFGHAAAELDDAIADLDYLPLHYACDAARQRPSSMEAMSLRFVEVADRARDA